MNIEIKKLENNIFEKRLVRAAIPVWEQLKSLPLDHYLIVSGFEGFKDAHKVKNSLYAYKLEANELGFKIRSKTVEEDGVVKILVGKESIEVKE